jgi:hypothetical protein
MNKTYLNLAILFLISILITLGCTNPKDSTTEPLKNVKSDNSVSPTSANTEKKAELTASYEIIEKWQLPNGGEGKRISIPETLRDEKGLFLVCDKISQDVKNDKNAFVFGHTDAKSAGIQKNLGKASKIEQAYLNKNFILDFKKNGNNGFNNCVIYPNGIEDLYSKKEKSYK